MFHVIAFRYGEPVLCSVTDRLAVRRLDNGPTCDYNVITYRRCASTMKTRLVQIGNSRGIRLPKLVIEEAGITDKVDLQVRKGTIVIRALNTPRSGWELGARALRDASGDDLLDPSTPTSFDEEEWKW